ncbi:uncharacterized protein LOC111710675 [Eurytemora carolleeae]|uniref:uncharacterized protein LOC111710675 n=1 Tax=Eurytemora carolleeae TaxID=1294199 RepID=UPI000C785D84|nr:uncharacterized protein LOC111710675 [Eurytemora carolleeae]|eukprot:XP_023340566.1 uncharacterized protein LOC111710675 [Eurytemora affinis]
MKSLIALSCVGLASLIAQVSAAPLIPAFLNPESGEVLVRVPRQLGDRPQQAFRPLRREDNEDISFADQETAADSSYAAPAAPLGRVKIQVYRGPSQGSGYDTFAPWGYYNTQPLDLDKYH